MCLLGIFVGRNNAHFYKEGLIRMVHFMRIYEGDLWRVSLISYKMNTRVRFSLSYDFLNSFYHLESRAYFRNGVMTSVTTCNVTCIHFDPYDITSRHGNNRVALCFMGPRNWRIDPVPLQCSFLSFFFFFF